MNLQWFTGEQKEYPRIRWVLYDTDGGCTPYKIMVHRAIGVVHQRHAIWIEKDRCWKGIHLPDLDDEALKALLLLEYKLQ